MIQEKKQPMKRMISGALAALLTITLALLALTGVFADVPEDLSKTLYDPAGRVIGIAARGVWSLYPENSLEGLLAVKGTGLTHVLADVSVTADGVAVLLPENGAARMLGASVENVSAMSSGDVLSMPMKNRLGGEANAFTEYLVSTLEDALPALERAGLTPVLKFDVSALDKVLPLAKGTNAVLYLTGKEKDVKAAAATLGDVPFLTEIRSNVIFHVTSFVDKMKDAGALGVVLKTSNRYGVNFYRSTLKRFDTLRAVIDCTEPETAGYREDTVKWWDDAISRGFSVIVTDDAEGFGRYLADCESARARLSTLYGYATNEAKIPAFNGELLNDYEKAYTDGVNTSKALLEDASSSLQDLRDAYTALNSALKTIELNYSEIEAGVAGKTVTLPRILLCVAFAAAVVAVQVYFYKKRKA
jgi:glycerophosphoryl diester phosphodiesterase